MAEAKEINQGNFQEEVLQDNGPVLVDFWAPWCGPCKMVAPVMEEIAKDYEGKVKVVKVNVDENTDLASQYDVMSIPTIKLFVNGKEVESLVGAQSKEDLEESIKGYL